MISRTPWMLSSGFRISASLAPLASFVLSFAFLGSASVALGQGDQWKSIPLPTSPKDIDGFSATIDLIHPESEGYLAVRFTAKASAGTFPGDRLLELQITPTNENFPKSETAYTIRMTLPAGQSMFEKTYYAPKWFLGSGLRFSIRDRDGPLTGYSTSVSSPLPKITQFQLTVSDIRPRLAILVPEPGNPTPSPALRIPDLRSWDCLHYPNANFMNAVNVRRLDDDEALNYLQTSSTTATQILRPSTTHDHWLGYECVDIVVTSFPLLQQLRTERPERFEALRQWLSTGGVIWTFAIPSHEKLADFFGVAPSSPSLVEEITEVDQALTKLSGENSFYSHSYVWLQYQQQLGGMSAEESAIAFGQLNVILGRMGQSNHPFAAQPSKETLDQLLQPLAVEAGVVVGIDSEDPFPGSFAQWYTTQHVSGANQYLNLRRGTSIASGSSHFWEWLLVNVSRPPVYGFLALLTFFVILVGPVSYQILRRIGRTHLMFLIAPMFALATTTMLFVYGFVADGFRTQTRVRQISWIDGTSGRGSTMTRATYYAPFKNSAGLVYRDQEAVYPVVEEDVAQDRNFEAASRIRQQWIGDEGTQRFTGEILPSRTQRQFLSYQPSANVEGLKVSLNGDTLMLENASSVAVQEFYHRIDDENYYQLRSACPPGSKATLEKIDLSQGGRKLRQLYIASQPEVPLGFARPDPSNRYRPYAFQPWNAAPPVDLSKASWAGSNDNWGIYESRLRTMLLDRAMLPVGWFVASASVIPESSAVKGAVVVDSIHFIMGPLP